MSFTPHDRYDVVIVGARCAGASTAMLLARQGFRVLCLDRAREGSDTLSTHALMRGAVLQLQRWGLLDTIVKEGTPEIRTTSFHYGPDALEVQIKPRAGVAALYAPRRSLLDAVLVRAAREAGAHVVHGVKVTNVLSDRQGRVRGVVTSGQGAPRRIRAGLVIGADGARSKIARLVEAPVEVRASHECATIYAYFEGLPPDGYHWYYAPGVSAGAIPTNGQLSNVFAAMPPERYRPADIEACFREVLIEAAPDLAKAVEALPQRGKFFAFPGLTGFIRRAWGPGWALVGDAGFFRDPITAHGITDALRDAELLTRALVRGGDAQLVEYQATRDVFASELLRVTDAVASFSWDLGQVQELHRALSRTMNSELDLIAAFDTSDVPARRSA
jgi:2-polyprenyl-6-methoxyphenol hydroxylase-like FAD-dependent oxidoreductase